MPPLEPSLLTHGGPMMWVLFGLGLNRSQVAQSQGVSYKTIDNQSCSVMRKLDIHSNAELVGYAIREKLASV